MWGMFRACGRFIWPVVYLLMIFVISMVAKINKKSYIPSVILLCVLLIQIVDLQNSFQAKSNEFKEKVTYSSMLQSDVWDELAKEKKHIVFVSHVSQNQDILFSISHYAYKNNMTINDYYFAHSANAGDIEKSKVESMENIQDDTLYVFKVADTELYEDSNLHCFEVDGVILGVK